MKKLDSQESSGKEKVLNIEEDLTNMLEKLMMEDGEDKLTSSSQSTSMLVEEEETPVFGDSRIMKRERSTQKKLVERVVERVPKKYKTSAHLSGGLSLNQEELKWKSSVQQQIITPMTSPIQIVRGMNTCPEFKLNYNNCLNMSNNNSLLAYQEENFPNFISPNFYSSFRGKFSYLIQNYNGSKLLQQSLANSDPQIISLIFEEIKFAIPSLIRHQYGNYFIQKFFLLLNQKMRLDFLNCITQHFFAICSDNIGNYPLQTIIESLISFEEQQMIVNALKGPGMVEKLAKDINAVHVLEKIITVFRENRINFLYHFLIENFVSLAINQNGLGLIKKTIIHSGLFATKKKIQKILMENFLFLIQNIYGNYSIQVAIEYWDNSLLVPILKLFCNKFAKLSSLKYSSNVVEKCLEKGGEPMVNHFIEEIITNSKIPSLIRNNYGNYVMSKALGLASPNYKLIFINNILQQLSNVDDKKIIIKWKHICDSTISLLINSPMPYGGNMTVYGCNYNNSNGV